MSDNEAQRASMRKWRDTRVDGWRVEGQKCAPGDPREAPEKSPHALDRRKRQFYAPGASLERGGAPGARTVLTFMQGAQQELGGTALLGSEAPK